MTLCELLERIPKEKKIRIGCKPGGNFIFNGICEKINKESKGYAILKNREVLETYSGLIEPDSTVIIINGKETGKYYNPRMPELTPNTINIDGIKTLIEAVYKNMITEYMKEKNPHKAAAVARMLKRDEYGIFENAQGVVDACKAVKKQAMGANV